LWLDIEDELKPEFLRTIFPEKLVFDGKAFRTPETASVLNTLREGHQELSGVASPPGFEVMWTIELPRKSA
jgi:hypothetical protein